MASVKDHYEHVLSDVYAWMQGGFDNALARNTAFFEKYGIRAAGSGIAVDLGAGCGFQSIPLANAGYRVTAIDLDKRLLEELNDHAGNLPIDKIQDDLLHFRQYAERDVELVVCMTDTLLHLESREKVLNLFAEVFAALESGGRFVITFRELTVELEELDRFLPVKSSDNIIFTCFLEYQDETVKVHDLVYKRMNGEWVLFKSFYHKLRLAKDWALKQLSECGFRNLESTVENGMVAIVATR